ncbi:GtrA family protein [Anaerofustis sp. NSJ-163]|uniref:GtrA family protein n=1 Tax=Anaerofustis sp. NSJ-163 TaxID=2944391 RepID=UPI00209C36F9|nr:GtrA family protein [Anaerofustis sp. NSJ-163]MCO8193090.1 YfhO family protein [Anaerofustis sp. NSJ-163]
MIEKINGLYEKYKEIILYIIFGGLTTLVNFVIYFVFTNVLSINYLVSNFIAWIGAVIFAFFTNKKYVFNANNTQLLNYIKEFIMFTSSRGFSFLIETFLLFLGVELIKLNDGVVKVAVAIIVVILNYFFTKFVFKNKEEKEEKREIVKENKKNNLKDSEVWYKRWYVVYTVLFLVSALFVFLPFIVTGRLLIWDTQGMNAGDGFTQHYASAAYLGNYFRDIIKNLIFNHELIIPMWDLTVGTGYDILTSLNYYALGDILNVFYIFTPEKYTGYMYSFLIVFRLYLSGLFFILFCFKFNKNKMSAILSAIGYVFCGYSLYASIRHPFFINPMIYLPLILIGVENVLRGKKPYLFIIMITISAISSFYFLYMLTIATIIYAFIRVMYIYKEKGLFLKKLVYYFFKFLFYYFIGILLSAIILLPVLIGFLGSARANGQVSNLTLFYNISYYINIFKYMFVAGSIGEWTFLGFNTIMIFTTFLVFKEKSKAAKYLKYILIILFIVILFPLFGYIMNGFSYVSNRWCFIVSFVISFINFYILCDIKYLIHKHLKYSYVILITLFLINFFINAIIKVVDLNNEMYIYNLLFICMSFFFIAFAINKEICIKNINLILILIYGFQIVMSTYLLYTPLGSSYMGEYKKTNKSLQAQLYNDAYDFIKQNDENIYRVSSSKERLNYGLINNINGLSSYFSIQNKHSVDYFFSTGMLAKISLSGNHGYDNHLISNELKGVKYYIAYDNNKHDIFKDYKKVKEFDDKTLYENTNNLGLFYTYDSAIGTNELNSLSVYDREYAMLQSVYLEKNTDLKTEKKYPKSKIIMNFEDILQNAQYNEKNIELKDDCINVKKDNSSITLNIKPIKNSETYLVLDDLNLVIEKKEKKNAGIKDKVKYLLSSSETQSDIEIYIDSSKKYNDKYIIRSTTDTYYVGINDYVLNLGYYEDGEHEIKLNFTKKGKFNFSDLKVVSQSMDNYDKYVNELKEDKVENFTIKGNTVSLNVNTKEDKIGVLSIPYSKGWKAYVNGKEVDVLQANVDSMGVELQKGANEVVFKYCTPGIKEGGIITLITALGCLIYIFVDKKKKAL